MNQINKTLSLFLMLAQMFSSPAFAIGHIQDADVASQTDLKSTNGTITGNISTSSPCITSPSSISGLFAGLYAYDSTTPGNITVGTTITAIPGTCSAGQIQLSVNSNANATGDTITFGAPLSAGVNTSKLWDNTNSQAYSTTLSHTVLNNQANTFTTGPQSLGSQALSFQLTNSSSGTTTNKLVVVNSSGQAVLASTSSTNGVVGIAISGAGTSGTVDISQIGQASCIFDGATTSGDFVQASTSSAGECHDAGASSPTNGSQVLGQVLSTNGSGGTYAMTLSLGGGGGGASSSGSKNYLTSYTASTSGGVANSGNGDFEAGSTTGWSLAHTSLTSLFPTSTASAGTPFDSTHGGSSASGNLSFSVTSTNPLQKQYSGSLASSAASTAGDLLISKAFYIDKADQSVPLYISLSSQVTAGAANLNFSGTSSNSFALYIYDVTDAVWIQPSGVYGMVSSGVYTPLGVYFQPQSNTATQYQLAVVNVNASSGAYTMLLDALSVGPQSQVMAPAMTDWATYTPTFTGLGTVTLDYAKWRRIGDTLFYEARGVAGTSTSSSASMSLPSVSIAQDGSGLPNYSGEWKRGATNEYTAGPMLVNWANSASVVYFGEAQSISASGFSPLSIAQGSQVLANGDAFTVSGHAKIQGWSSNTAASSDTDTTVVAFAISAAGQQSIAFNGNVLFTNYASPTYDPNGGWNSSGSYYVIPVSGKYRVSMTGYLPLSGTTPSAVNTEVDMSLYQNASNPYSASFYAQSTSGTQKSLTGGTTIDAKAGDQISLKIFQNLNGSAVNFSVQDFSISRLSGPAVVQATESIIAIYNGQPTGTLTNSFNLATIPTKIRDDHNMCSSGTCTISVAGTYQVSAQLAIQQVFAAGGGVGLKVIQSGSTSDSLETYVNDTSSTGNVGAVAAYPSVTGLFHCLSGDTIVVDGYADGTSTAYNGNGNRSRLSIARVGN